MKIKRCYLWLTLILILYSISSIGIYELKVKNIIENKGFTDYLNCDTSGKKLNIADNTIVQNIKVIRDLAKINIMFDEYKKDSNGKINISIINLDTKEEIQKETIKNSDVKNSQYWSIILEKNVNSINEIAIKITGTEKDSNNSPSVLSASINTYEDGDLFINGEKQNSDLYISLTTNKSMFIKYLYSFIVVLVGIFIATAYVILFIKPIKIHNAFIILATMLGIIYMCLFTPNSMQDERKHINTAIRYSNMFMLKGYKTEDGNMIKRVDDTTVYGLNDETSISSYYAVITHITDLQKSDDVVEVPGEMIGNIFQYIPTAVGVTIGRLLRLGYVPTIYIGRICNLIYYVMITYLSIRIAPFGKKMFFVIGMLPVAIHVSGSFSYDAIVISTALCFIAYVLYFAFSDNELTRRKIIFILMLTIILSAAKAGVYVFLLLLLLLIPKKRIYKHRKIIVSLFLLGLIVIAYFNKEKIMWSVTVTDRKLPYFDGDRAYPFSYVYKDFYGYLRLVINTIVNNFDFYLESLVGGYLCCKNVIISKGIVFGYYIILFLSIILNKDESVKIKRVHKIIMVIICFIIFNVFLTVALTWTKYGDKSIWGLSGRYFVPLLPLMLLILRNKNLVFLKDYTYKILFSVCILELLTIFNSMLLVLEN